MDNVQEMTFDQSEERLVNPGLKIFLRKIFKNWFWVLLSAVIGVATAYLYVKYTTPIYTATAKMFIKDDSDNKAAAGSVAAFSELFNTTSSVDNEAEIMQTRYLMEKVVKLIKADVTYYFEGRVHASELYPSPFELKFINKRDTITPNKFFLQLINDRINITSESGFKKEVTFGQPFLLPGIGEVSLIRNYNIKLNNGKYSFEVGDFDRRVAGLMSSLSVNVANKQVSIIYLNFSSPVKKKAEDILSVLMQQYQLENIIDKNRIADSTISFIQNRLVYVSKELSDVEGAIQTFKQKNNLTDISIQSKLLLENSSQYQADLLKANAQIDILNQLEKYLKDEKGNKRIFPNDLLDDPSFSALIQKNNSLVLDRERQLLSTTEDNPYIKNLDQQIVGLRKDMLSSLVNSRAALLISRNGLQQKINQFLSQVKGIPEKERNFLNLSRQQQIKQELYIFLMQKREETAISKTSNISNSRIIDPPKAGEYPISPKKKLIYFAGLVIGILLPLMILYIRELLNDKLISKEEISLYTKVPIIGEISHTEDGTEIVSVSTRSIVGEQFRALRTNLNFFLNIIDKPSKIILVTSSMAGEGKSFTAINLGLVLAMTGKRVLLMEMDLRKPTLTLKLGVTANHTFLDYILNKEVAAESIINTTALDNNLCVISSGQIPPNPTEIILSPRMGELVDVLKQRFDYIIMDTPPVGLVTDAQILSTYSDATLYLVRANFTLKSQLNIPNEFHFGRKMKNMSIVLNDVEYSDTYGYSYGYYYGSYLDHKHSKFGWLSKLKKK